jgi:hypothetical protein
LVWWLVSETAPDFPLNPVWRCLRKEFQVHSP